MNNDDHINKKRRAHSRTKRNSSWKYYDKQGNGPFARFLRPDNPFDVYPTRRMILFLFLGCLLSTIGIRLTADEYFEGPKQTFPYHLLTGNRPIFPVNIAFKNVGCSVAGISDPILSNITGEILFGKLTGIMGMTGSGKSTLCNMILGRGKRYCTSKTHGTVYLNGRPRDLETFLDRVGFVPQEDTLYSDLTVEEVLAFSANWRLPRDMTASEKQRVVEQTLETLDLKKLRHRRIGNMATRGISGGERKRASIGEELVSLPSVLVMDEPTSGLDSTGTFHLMTMLRNVSMSGVSVVTIIHQPSERVFNLLDNVILMQNGEAAYIGRRDGIFPFLFEMGYRQDNSSGGSFKIPSAEYILDVLARHEQPSKKLSQKTVDSMCHEAAFGPYFSTRNSTKPFIPQTNSNHRTAVQSTQNQTRECLSRSDNFFHPFLPTFFRYRSEKNGYWRMIESEMQPQRDREDLDKCIEAKWRKEVKSSKKSIHSPETLEQQVQLWKMKCQQAHKQQTIDQQNNSLLARLKLWFSNNYTKGEKKSYQDYPPSYQQLPKAGFKQQMQLWFWQMILLKWRRGLFIEWFIVALLAQVVGFVRSFNCTWNRRAISNLFLSISISLLGMVGAVFNDEIGPVQRAASAGMSLGAHEFAILAENIVWGWCNSHIFALNYFMVLWARTGIWILDITNMPSNTNCNCWILLRKYYEFAHFQHLNYLASGSLGIAICVFVNHNTSRSYIASVAVLITCHVFALFTPNQNQITRNATLFRGRLDLGPLVQAICSVSYVRYYLEAIFLWDISPRDSNGRSYVMRYFGYKESNKTYCATSMFALWTFAQTVRFLVFGFKNSNDFHSLYDTPLLIIFIFKVVGCHFVALVSMTIIQEWYFPWMASLQEKVDSADTRGGLQSQLIQ